MVMRMQLDCSLRKASAKGSVSSILAIKFIPIDSLFLSYGRLRERGNQIPLKDCNVLFYMMKHQDWVSNRGYEQHLTVLTKIYTRNHSSRLLRQSHLLPAHSPTRTTSPRDFASLGRGKDALPIKDQQILWENYHLGKRIIETPPVISKKRLDQDYRKHKRLVQCLTASSHRKSKPEDFRVQKLQQYKENIDHKAYTPQQPGSHRCHVSFRVKALVLYRQRPLFDQLTIVLGHSSKEGRLKRQKSESFPAENLTNRSFCFRIPKRLAGLEEEPLVVEVQQQKGLHQQSVGYFSFPCKPQVETTAQFFHCGKPIGEVAIEAAVGQKQEEEPRC